MYSLTNICVYVFSLNLNVYIYSIIIILSSHQQGYHWPYLAAPPYRSLLPVSPQAYTPYPHKAAVCRFELVARLLLVHTKGSLGVHHLWARPEFACSVRHVCFFYLGEFSWWVVVAIQLLLYGVLPPGLVQYRFPHSCVVAVKLFLHIFS